MVWCGGLVVCGVAGGGCRVGLGLGVRGEGLQLLVWRGSPAGGSRVRRGTLGRQTRPRGTLGGSSIRGCWRERQGGPVPPLLSHAALTFCHRPSCRPGPPRPRRPAASCSCRRHGGSRVRQWCRARRRAMPPAATQMIGVTTETSAGPTPASDALSASISCSCLQRARENPAAAAGAHLVLRRAVGGPISALARSAPACLPMARAPCLDRVVLCA